MNNRFLRLDVQLSRAVTAIRSLVRVLSAAGLAANHGLSSRGWQRREKLTNLASVEWSEVDTSKMSVHSMVEGDKTWLRPALWGFTEEELERRYRWSKDDDLQYWSGSIPSGRSFNHFKQTVLQRDWPDDGRRVSYAIFSKEFGLIGMVSCYNIEPAKNMGELGVYLGEQDNWGHGYGTDAVLTFMRHLFGALGFKFIYLHTYESNVRAQRSYLRVGFQVVDRRRRYSTRLGYHEEVRMAITRDQFAQLHGLEESVATA